MRLPCPLPLLSSLSSPLPTFFYQSSGFIDDTETCVSTNVEAVNNLEKSQYVIVLLSDQLMIESY